MYSDYRRRARELCSNTSGTLAVIYLIYSLIIGAVSYTLIGFIILAGPLTMGYIEAIVKNRNGQEISPGTLFSRFDDFGGHISVYLLQLLYLMLWALIPIAGFFIVLVKTYSYSMTMYIHRDNPKLSADDCITESRKMMNGHKMNLFLLHLSYIGWILLSILTFGILFFWVAPKMETAQYLFYEDLKDKKEEE